MDFCAAAYLPSYTTLCYNTHEFPLLGVGRWCERTAWQRRYRHEAEVLLHNRTRKYAG